MMLQTLFTSPLDFALIAISLTLAITIHEFAHAYMADHLGDPTPRSQGRVSLNPLSHLDPLGTIMLLIAGFGWGRPVIFDPYNLRSPRRDTTLISLAGPASNITLAIIISLAAKLIPTPLTLEITYSLIYFNILLAIFNLVPVYPLDGQKILSGLLPADLARDYEAIMQRYGTLILILLIFPFFGHSLVSSLISPAINFLVNLLI